MKDTDEIPKTFVELTSRDEIVISSSDIINNRERVFDEIINFESFEIFNFLYIIYEEDEDEDEENEQLEVVDFMLKYFPDKLPIICKRYSEYVEKCLEILI